MNKSYQRPLCWISFRTEDFLHCHFRDVHDQKFKCTICDYRSSRKNDVIRHQRFKHLDIELNILSKLLKISNKRYKCGFCEYGNDNISMLKRHQELKH